jgi:hypothetical protein
MCKKDVNSTAGWDADFYVSIEKVRGSGPNEFEPAGGDDKHNRAYFFKPTDPDVSGSKGAESWKGKDTTLSYVEVSAFNIPDNDFRGDNIKLTDYRLKVQVNKPFDKAPSQIWVSNRDNTLSMDRQGDTFMIDLSKFQLYDGDFLDMNIQKFTLQPYDSQAVNGRDPGARAICVWTQLQKYDFSGYPFLIVQASSVGPAQKSYIPQGGTDAVSAGGLAIHIDQNGLYGQNLIIEIDGEYDSNVNHLSMAWEDNSGLYCLDLKAEIAVTGAGRLNGYAQLLKTLSGHEDAVATGILDLGSSVAGPTGFAVDVSGVSFVNCPRRGKSTVQLNGFPLTDRFNASTATNSYGPVKCFDTKMIAYIDASDGPTTQASDKVNSMFGKSSIFDHNFILGADDNIKPQASGVRFVDTTILQGDAGCPINLGAYGFTNGSIARSVIHGVWIHRIMHKFTKVSFEVSDSGYGAQEDNCGGLVTNRTGFSLFEERFKGVGFVEDDNALGLSDVRISRLYVPSLVDGSVGMDVNSVTRTLTLSALSNYGGYGRTYFSKSYHTKQDNQKFCIKGLNISGAVHPERDPDYLIYSTGHDDKTAVFKSKPIQPEGSCCGPCRCCPDCSVCGLCGLSYTVKSIYYYDIDDQGQLVGEVSVEVDDIVVNIEPSISGKCHGACTIC